MSVALTAVEKELVDSDRRATIHWEVLVRMKDSRIGGSLRRLRISEERTARERYAPLQCANAVEQRCTDFDVACSSLARPLFLLRRPAMRAREKVRLDEVTMRVGAGARVRARIR